MVPIKELCGEFEEKVVDFITNRKDRPGYEIRKASNLGYSSIQDYVREKLIKEATKTTQSTVPTPAQKSTKFKTKNSKTVHESKCG